MSSSVNIVVTQPNPTAEMIASPWHLAIVISAAGLNAYRAAIFAAQSRAGFGPGRSWMYLRTITFELAFLAIVILGVWLHGSSLRTIFGQRWKSARELLRDLGIGIALWSVALIAVSVLGGLIGHEGSSGQSILFLLPQTGVEKSLWILVSVAAGICEEAIYRGYFQRQFGAITGSATVAIVASSILFGAVHLYQGWSRATIIAISAILFGAVAEWRGSVRPGMFAHSFQDAIAPLLIKVMRH
jgi:membrane protease YdiL (CAAX protease family)